MAAKAPIALTSLSPKSGSNFVLGVGAIFHNVDTSEIKEGMDYEELAKILDGWREDDAVVGAITGGGNLIINHNIEPLETDGLITRVVGMMRMGAIDVSLNTTIQEITVENLLRLIPTAYKDESGAIRSHNQILPEHFKPIVWAGARSDGAVMVVEIMNAIQTNEINMNFNEANTGMTVPANWVGTARTLDDMRSGAYKIWFIGMDGNGTAGGSSIAGATLDSLMVLTVPQLRDMAATNNVEIPINVTRKEDIANLILGK